MPEDTTTIETEVEETEVEAPAETTEVDERVAKANAEAAKRRKELREVQAELKKYQDRDKTESQKAAERIAELESRLKAAETKELKLTAAAAAGIPSKYATRLVGETEAELLADAKQMAEDLGLASTDKSNGSSRGPRDNGQGVRRPADKPKSMNDMLKGLGR